MRRVRNLYQGARALAQVHAVKVCYAVFPADVVKVRASCDDARKFSGAFALEEAHFDLLLLSSADEFKSKACTCSKAAGLRSALLQ